MNRGEAQRVSAMLLPYFLPAGFRTAPQQTERLVKGASLSRKGQIALTTAYLILYQTRFVLTDRRSRTCNQDGWSCVQSHMVQFLPLG